MPALAYTKELRAVMFHMPVRVREGVHIYTDKHTYIPIFENE